MVVKKYDLYSLVDYLKEITGNKDLSLEWAYGRPKLIQKLAHGYIDISPRLPRGQLYDWIQAYIKGFEAGCWNASVDGNKRAQ